jgi:hypothetical protein
MVRVCGMLGSRVCGLFGSVCGSVGLAVLVVALAAMATRHAYAEDPRACSHRWSLMHAMHHPVRWTDRCPMR